MAGIAVEWGTTIKQVQCACGYHFAYEIERHVTGTYHGFALSENKAQAKAQLRAKSELERLLNEGVEACPCPRCGSLTSEMRRKLEDDRLDHGPEIVRDVLWGMLFGGIAWWMGSQSLREFLSDHPLVGSLLGLVALFFGAVASMFFLLATVSLVRGHRDKLIKSVVEISRAEASGPFWFGVIAVWPTSQKSRPPDRWRS